MGQRALDGGIAAAGSSQHRELWRNYFDTSMVQNEIVVLCLRAKVKGKELHRCRAQNPIETLNLKTLHPKNSKALSPKLRV